MQSLGVMGIAFAVGVAVLFIRHRQTVRRRAIAAAEERHRAWEQEKAETEALRVLFAAARPTPEPEVTVDDWFGHVHVRAASQGEAADIIARSPIFAARETAT